MHVQCSAGSINMKSHLSHVVIKGIFTEAPNFHSAVREIVPKSDVLTWLLGLLVPQRKSPVPSSILHPTPIPPSPQGTGTSLLSGPPCSAQGAPCGGTTISPSSVHQSPGQSSPFARIVIHFSFVCSHPRHQVPTIVLPSVLHAELACDRDSADVC